MNADDRVVLVRYRDSAGLRSVERDGLERYYLVVRLGKDVVWESELSRTTACLFYNALRLQAHR